MVNKVWNPTDVQKKVMDVLANAEKPLTLAEISEAVGADVKTGSINALVKKGYIGHGDYVEKIVQAKRKVMTYKLEKSL